MDLDNVLRKLQPFGRYQRLFLLHMFTFAAGFPAAITMIMVFVASDPESFHCKSPKSLSYNATLPAVSESDDNTTSSELNECDTYALHDGIPSKNLTSCRSGWEYSHKYGETSIVSEFDLVCDRRLLKDTAVSIFMTGLLLGAYPMGQMADIWGRKIVMFVSIFLLGVSGIVMACVQNYYAFVVMWFFVGIFRQGTMTAGFVLLIELYPPERRALIGSIMNIGWGVAVVILALLAYFLRDWRHLQLLLSIGILVGLPFWWIIYESARWLLCQERIEDADRILHKIAKFNHITAPSAFLKRSEAEQLVHQNKEINDNSSKADKDDNPKADENTKYSKLETETDRNQTRKLTVLDLFKRPNLAKNTLILSLDWVAASFTYYGLSLNSAHLAGNKYLNFFLLSLVEIPAYIFCYITLEHFGGRRLTTSISLLVAGIACIITVWIPKTSASGSDLTTVITTFAMIGKFAISYAFAGVVVYTPEIFPTGVRSAANGLLSSLSRVGGMLAPFVVRLNDVSYYLPLNIFGAFSIVSGLMTLFLPETRNMPLPETLDDGEMIGKRKPATNPTV